MSRFIGLCAVLALSMLAWPSAATAADREGNTPRTAKTLGLSFSGAIDYANDIDWWRVPSSSYRGTFSRSLTSGIVDNGGLRVTVYRVRRPGRLARGMADLVFVKTVTLTPGRYYIRFTQAPRYGYYLKLAAARRGATGEYWD